MALNDVGIFPALPGLAWSVTKSPISQTRIQRAVSGRELRALDYPYPLYQFQLTFAVLRQNVAGGYNELNTLMAFYKACQGAYGTFLFDDPTDDTITGQLVGVGDSSNNAFQLVRTNGGLVAFTEPVVAVNQLSAVYLAGIRQNPVTYSCATGLNSTGILTFSAPPATGTAITADFSYYFRCRFVNDSYEFENFMYQLWRVQKLSFMTVFA
jgi:uncharacterized protein (TIGR02217 family)